MATIWKRGNLQWQARVRRNGYPTQNRTFDTKNEAEIWARGIESEMDKGIFVSRKEAENTTLDEALERFILEYIPRLKDPAKDTRRARALQRRAISSRILASIRGKDISDFIRERESEGVKGNTIRLDLAVLSRLFNIARGDWGMESLVNPVSYVSKPKVSKGRERRLEPAPAGEEKDEETRLLEACPPNFRLAVRFALETAMRRSEIEGLTWERVDLARRCALLPQTKNDTARAVPLSPAALEVLAEVSKPHTGAVFRMSANAITQAFEKARMDAGISNLVFHDLRHEATSRFFENTDLDIMEIRSITGHKNLQMLARYSHLRTHRLAARLAGARRGEEENAEKKRLGRPRKGEAR